MVNLQNLGLNDKRLNNPGTLLDLTAKSTAVFPMFFYGFQLNVHNTLDKNLKIVNTLNLKSAHPFRLQNGIYFGNRRFGEKIQAAPTLFGPFVSSCKTEEWSDSRLKFDIDTRMATTKQGSVIVSPQAAVHYLGDSFTASAVLVSPGSLDVFPAPGYFLLQYLQAVTSNISLGSELALAGSAAVSSYQSPTFKDLVDSKAAVVGRYDSDQGTVSAAFGTSSMLLSCYKKFHARFETGMEFKSNFTEEYACSSALAFRATVPNRGITLRGRVDTGCNVGVVFEKRNWDSRFVFSISVKSNIRAKNLSLGLGVTVE